MRGVSILAGALLSLGPSSPGAADVVTAPARTARLAIQPAPPGRLPGAVTLKPTRGTDRRSLLERADRLLYQAKEGGRHQARHDDGSGATRRVGPDAVPVS